MRSEEHTSELQSLRHLVCRLLLEKKKKTRETQKKTYNPSTQVPTSTVRVDVRRHFLFLCQMHRLGFLQFSWRRLFFFFFNDTATTEIYTLSLHDALPILLERNELLQSLLFLLLAARKIL